MYRSACASMKDFDIRSFGELPQRTEGRVCREMFQDSLGKVSVSCDRTAGAAEKTVPFAWRIYWLIGIRICVFPADQAEGWPSFGRASRTHQDSRVGRGCLQKVSSLLFNHHLKKLYSQRVFLVAYDIQINPLGLVGTILPLQLNPIQKKNL